MIANSINNLPIAIRNEVSDYEAIDLLTPNRLRLGRNNERCPDGEMITMVNPLNILDENTNIFTELIRWFLFRSVCLNSLSQNEDYFASYISCGLNLKLILQSNQKWRICGAQKLMNAAQHYFTWHKEVKPGEWDHVDRQLPEVSVQLAREPETKIKNWKIKTNYW